MIPKKPKYAINLTCVTNILSISNFPKTSKIYLKLLKPKHWIKNKIECNDVFFFSGSCKAKIRRRVKLNIGDISIDNI